LPLELKKQNKKGQTILFSQKEIRILFLKNNKEKNVEAYESYTLPCSTIIKRLNQGESVFISNKKFYQEKNKLKKPITSKSSLYLNRI
jgi:hypothetical protein